MLHALIDQIQYFRERVRVPLKEDDTTFFRDSHPTDSEFFPTPIEPEVSPFSEYSSQVQSNGQKVGKQGDSCTITRLKKKQEGEQ